MQIKIAPFKEKNILTLMLPQPIVSGTILLTDTTEIKTDSFLGEIMADRAVNRLLIAGNTLAVYYAENTNIGDLQAFLVALIDDFYQSPQNLDSLAQTANSALLIETIADVFIRPTLYADKGDIEIISYSDNILTLRFMGHCAGCPYAQNTLNNVIAKAFNQHLPQPIELKTAENSK